MSTHINTRVVYDYIKNFCYDPIYRTEVVVLEYDHSTIPPTPPDLSKYPFQFSETTYYVPGACCIYNDTLYVAISEGAGPWTIGTIANRYLGDEDSLREDAENAAFLSDVKESTSGAYNATRFKPITISENYGVRVVELYNRRDDTFELAFNSMATAREYIRIFSKLSSYDIQVTAGGYKATVEFVGNGTADSFSLPGIPEELISVEIDLSPVTDYTVTNNTVTFTEIPDDGADIRVTYIGKDFTALWDDKTMVFYD